MNVLQVDVSPLCLARYFQTKMLGKDRFARSNFSYNQHPLCHSTRALDGKAAEIDESLEEGQDPHGLRVFGIDRQACKLNAECLIPFGRVSSPYGQFATASEPWSDSRGFPRRLTPGDRKRDSQRSRDMDPR